MHDLIADLLLLPKIKAYSCPFAYSYIVYNNTNLALNNLYYGLIRNSRTYSVSWANYITANYIGIYI